MTVTELIQALQAAVAENPEVGNMPAWTWKHGTGARDERWLDEIQHIGVNAHLYISLT